MSKCSAFINYHYTCLSSSTILLSHLPFVLSILYNVHRSPLTNIWKSLSLFVCSEWMRNINTKIAKNKVKTKIWLRIDTPTIAKVSYVIRSMQLIAIISQYQAPYRSQSYLCPLLLISTLHVLTERLYSEFIFKYKYIYFGKHYYQIKCHIVRSGVEICIFTFRASVNAVRYLWFLILVCTNHSCKWPNVVYSFRLTLTA